jgi:tetratricopeptide (TPR) repeat protein
MGSRTEAISAFKMSLQLRQALYGNDHQDVACLHYNIGTLQMESLQLDEAFLSLRETLRIKRLGSFKEDPDKIFSTISKLARLQEGKGRIKEALLTRQEMLELLTSSPQVKQEALSETLLRMSQLYHATGELSRAMGLAQISLEALMQCDILREVIVTDFNNYISTVEMAAKSMMYIGSLYHELVDLENARGVFEHARTFVFHVVNHYGATQGTSQLIPMLEVLHQLSVPSCAPQA